MQLLSTMPKKLPIEEDIHMKDYLNEEWYEIKKKNFGC